MRHPIGYRSQFPEPLSVADPEDRKKLNRTVSTYLFPMQIRLMRGSRGWTQQELANRMGKHLSYIQRLESGRCNLTMGTVEKIAEVFDCGVMVSLHSFFSMVRALSNPGSISRIDSWSDEQIAYWNMTKSIHESQGHFYGTPAPHPTIDVNSVLNDPGAQIPRRRRGRPPGPSKPPNTMDQTRASRAAQVQSADDGDGALPPINADDWSVE